MTPCKIRMPSSGSTEGPWWGYPMLILGAVCSFLEPFCGHLSPKVDKIFQKLLLNEVSKGLAWWRDFTCGGVSGLGGVRVLRG